MTALCSCPLIVGLPGAARMAVVDAVVVEAARQGPWGAVDDLTWSSACLTGGGLEGLDPEVKRACQVLLGACEADPVLGGTLGGLPQYQFRVGSEWRAAGSYEGVGGKRGEGLYVLPYVLRAAWWLDASPNNNLSGRAFMPSACELVIIKML